MNEHQTTATSASPGAPVEDRCPRCREQIADAWLVCAWCGEQLAASAELPSGAELADGRYRILSVIGKGGFGITYEAGDVRLRRRVAIKELFPDTAVRHGSLVLTPPEARASFRGARERFLQEARVLARFTHPGIVRVYEVFEQHGTAYLVMERIAGQTLVDVLRMRRAPLGEDEILDVAGRVAAALRPVHAAGVLHRDVNPSNVMLTPQGRIVVIDFGLARDFTPDHTVGMTRVVTPGYAPIEQYRGEARFGPATDVYGLAATCYRLATGAVPPAAVDRDGGAVLRPAAAINPAISKAVSDAIGDGLEVEAGHRPQDLDAFLARLGVRRLPDDPRSILAAPPGATASSVVGGLWDPGPAAGTASAGTAAATRTVGPVDLDAAAAAPPGHDSATVHGIAHDADRTIGDPDATRPEGAGDATFVPAATAPVAAGDAGPDPTRWEDAEGRLAPPPRPVGHAPARSKVTVPLVILALALAAAAPVLTTLLLVLVALPVLATIGDSLGHRQRAHAGIAGGWSERHLSPGALAPGRFLRNAVVSVVRVSPILGVSALVLGAWYVLGASGSTTATAEGSLRLIGVATVGAVLAASRTGTDRFRCGDGVDWLVARLVPGGKMSERVLVGWIIVALAVAAALWLRPDPFPLP